MAATAIVHGAAVVTVNVVDYRQAHPYFRLSGPYHPGRDEWVIPVEESRW